MHWIFSQYPSKFNTLRLRQNDRPFPDAIFNCIFLNENVWNMITLKFVPQGSINNIPVLVQVMAWGRPDDKGYLNQCWYMCITQPHWVNAWTMMVWHVIKQASSLSRENALWNTALKFWWSSMCGHVCHVSYNSMLCFCPATPDWYQHNKELRIHDCPSEKNWTDGK